MNRPPIPYLSPFVVLFAALFSLAVHSPGPGGQRHDHRDCDRPQRRGHRQRHVVVHNDDIGSSASSSPATPARSRRQPSPSGTTRSRVNAAGFARYKRTGITLTVGQTLNLTLPVTIAGSETVTVRGCSPVRQYLLRPDLRPGRRAPGQGTSAERTQLRPVACVESRHRELHQPAFRQHGNLELLGGQHVLRLRPPPPGQSLPAEWHRVHRRIADQHHPRRNLRPAARYRRHPRVQRGHRYLLRLLRQARRRAGVHLHHRRHQHAAWQRL